MKALELYIHIPFCVKKCNYCDFLSFSSNKEERSHYLDQLITEITVSGELYKEYEVSTIFIGGGTPSILNIPQMTAMMETIRQSFHVLPSAEISMEANPGAFSYEKADVWRKLGINRLSLGLQSADAEELKTLGRIHTYEDFLDSFQAARDAGFTNINVDLMSALPGQTMESYEDTLEKVLSLKPEHISAYSLILEEGTPFFDWYEAHEDELPGEEADRMMYHLTKERLKSHGYERYEISNYAKAGYSCRHNVGYWTGVEYLGLGLGASSYRKGQRFHNTEDMREYLSFTREDFRQERHLREVETLSNKEQMEEFMFLGLRLTKGVSSGEFNDRFQVEITSIYGAVLEKLQEEKLLLKKEAEGDIRYCFTDLGLDLSNYCLSEFLL